MRKIGSFVIGVSVVYLCLVSLFAAVSDAYSSRYVPGELIVKFAGKVEPQLNQGRVSFGVLALDALNASYLVSQCQPLFRNQELAGVYLLHFDLKADAESVAREYAKAPGIEYAEANYIARIGATYPNDPYFPEQWGLYNTGQGGGDPGKDIHAPEAWDIETGDPSVIIAILDTGIDLDHPDLASKIWVNADEIPGNGIDDDGNGFVDDVHGWDFINADADPQDDYGHGTHVAGIAGAAANNGQGIAGVCWECSLMPVKVLNASGNGPYSVISQGIEYAANNGAKIINLSLGSETFSQTLQDAVNYAHGHGAVVVGAAGNFNESNPFYPATCTNALAVAGLDHDDVKYQLSGYGGWIDLCAPAVGIKSTVYYDTYIAWSGTSMAAPFVSGVAGLLFSAHSGWSNNMVENQMLKQADNVDGSNPTYAGLLGKGRVNAFACLSITPIPELSYMSCLISDPSPGDNDGVLDPNETVTMMITIFNDWGDATGVTGMLSTSDSYVTINDASGVYGDIGAGQSAGNSGDTFGITLANSCPAGHVVLFNLQLQDDQSHSWNLPFSLTTGSREYTVPNHITADTTWLENETYLVTSDTAIDNNATLTIQPGVKVKIGENRVITVSGGGRVIAVGSEANPITFTSMINGTRWRGIELSGSGNNAVYDQYGNYMSGATFQYVIFEYANTPLNVMASSPYFANNLFQFNNSGLYFWACDNYSYQGNGPYIYNNRFIDNSYWSITSYACSGIIRGNIISGSGISIFYPCQLYGVINITIENNYITNCSNSRETLRLNNTGTPPFSSAVINVNNNIIFNNTGGCSNDGADVYLSGLAGNSQHWNIIHNTIFGNTCGTKGTVMSYATKLIMEYNNFINNHTNLTNKQDPPWYEIVNSSHPDWPLLHNWWGTTNTDEIDAFIYDYYDDQTLGRILFSPILTSFDEESPPILLDLTTQPSSPVGAEPVVFTLTFKGMDTNIQPTVTFGLEEPFEQHQIFGDWVDDHHWMGTFYVAYFTGDGENTVKVSGAKDCGFGTMAIPMEIPVDTFHTFVIDTGVGGVEGVEAHAIETAISITWQQNPKAAGYYLYYADNPIPPYDEQIDVGNVGTYMLTSLPLGQTYYFVVQAYDDNYATGPYSAQVWATLPPPIPALKMTGLAVLILILSTLFLFFLRTNLRG